MEHGTLKEVKAILKSLVISSPDTITIENLNRDYRQIVGGSIPFRRLGFHSLENFLHSIPDTLRVHGSGHSACVHNVRNEKSIHVEELVYQQRSNRRSKSRLRHRNSNYNSMRNANNIHSSNQKHRLPVQQLSNFQATNRNVHARTLGVRLLKFDSNPENANKIRANEDNSGYNNHSAPQASENTNVSCAPAKSYFDFPLKDEQYKAQEKNIAAGNKETNTIENFKRLRKIEYPRYADMNRARPEFENKDDSNYETQNKKIAEDIKRLCNVTHPRSADLNEAVPDFNIKDDSNYETQNKKIAEDLKRLCNVTHPRSADLNEAVPDFNIKDDNKSDSSQETLIRAENVSNKCMDLRRMHARSEREKKITAEENRETNRMQDFKRPCNMAYPRSVRLYEAVLEFEKKDDNQHETQQKKIAAENKETVAEAVADNKQLNKIKEFMRWRNTRCQTSGNLNEPVPESHVEDDKKSQNQEKKITAENQEANSFKTLFDINEPQSIDFNEAVPEFAANKEVYRLDFPEHTVPFGRQIPKLKVPDSVKVGSVIPIFIAEIHSPFKFWFHIHQKDNELDMLMHQIERFYGTLAEMELCIPIECLNRGQVCAARFYDLWHRAEILAPAVGNKIKVYFIDYATVTDIDFTDIKYLVSRFAHLPAQAIRGSLSHIKPRDLHWSPEATEHFLAMGEELMLFAKITEIDENDSIYYMIICNTHDAEVIQINKELVTRGFALFDKQWDESIIKKNKGFRVHQAREDFPT